MPAYPYSPYLAVGQGTTMTPFPGGYYGPVVGQLDPAALAQLKAGASQMQPAQQQELFDVSASTDYHKKQVNIQRALFGGVGLLVGVVACMAMKKGRR